MNDRRDATPPDHASGQRHEDATNLVSPQDSTSSPRQRREGGPHTDRAQHLPGGSDRHQGARPSLETGPVSADARSHADETAAAAGRAPSARYRTGVVAATAKALRRHRPATARSTDADRRTALLQGARQRKRALFPAVSLMLWILAQIAYPLVTGAARDQVTVVVVLLAAGTALAHAAAVRGAAYALGFLVIVSGLGLLSEIAGTATGIPYGCYSYALDRLGPALADVPLVVPLAWTGGIYPIWVIAGLLVRRPAVRMVVLAAGAVGWDLFLDPQMVADGQWAWCVTDTGLPGMSHIPYTNYLGWFAVALVMAGLLTVWERVAPGDASDGPVGVAVAMFLWTWLGSMLAHAVFLGLPVSAVYGGLGLAWLGVGLLIRLVRGGNERIRFR